MNYEQKAIALHDYIKAYTPTNWIEPVGRVDAAAVPAFMPDEVKDLEEYHRTGNLEERLNTIIKKWYIREAIAAFFDKYGE